MVRDVDGASAGVSERVPRGQIGAAARMEAREGTSPTTHASRREEPKWTRRDGSPDLLFAKVKGDACRN
jgi:hypothetical protein